MFIFSSRVTIEATPVLFFPVSGCEIRGICEKHLSPGHKRLLQSFQSLSRLRKTAPQCSFYQNSGSYLPLPVSCLPPGGISPWSGHTPFSTPGLPPPPPSPSDVPPGYFFHKSCGLQVSTACGPSSLHPHSHRLGWRTIVSGPHSPITRQWF